MIRTRSTIHGSTKRAIDKVTAAKNIIKLVEKTVSVLKSNTQAALLQDVEELRVHIKDVLECLEFDEVSVVLEFVDDLTASYDIVLRIFHIDGSQSNVFLTATVLVV
jgi:hypothetical protein